MFPFNPKRGTPKNTLCLASCLASNSLSLACASANAAYDGDGSTSGARTPGFLGFKAYPSTSMEPTQRSPIRLHVSRQDFRKELEPILVGCLSPFCRGCRKQSNKCCYRVAGNPPSKMRAWNDWGICFGDFLCSFRRAHGRSQAKTELTYNLGSRRTVHLRLMAFFPSGGVRDIAPFSIAGIATPTLRSRTSLGLKQKVRPSPLSETHEPHPPVLQYFAMGV